MTTSKKPLLDRYEDPTGSFSNRRLKVSTWYLTHRELLRHIVIGVLVVWCVISMSIGLFVWGKYLLVDYARDQANIASIATQYISRDAIERQAPTPLVFGSASTYMAGPDRYDFAIEVGNSNDAWIATVEYRFTYADGETEAVSAVVLPGQERLLTVFGHERFGRPSGVSFEHLHTSWQRVSAHAVPDPLMYIAQRVDVSTDSIVYVPANRSLDIATAVVRFNLTNHSLFGYWEYPFLVRFVQGGQVIGITSISVPEFHNGEEREIAIAVFFDHFAIDDILITPVVNVFDPQVYLPL